VNYLKHPVILKRLKFSLTLPAKKCILSFCNDFVMDRHDESESSFTVAIMNFIGATEMRGHRKIKKH